jgi:adenylate kinase
MRIILLGLAGAGKGTQAQMLARHMGVAHVASGDLFRQNQEQGTELGLLVKQYMERGELVPDDVTIRLIMDRIGQEDCRQGFILDGFPRTMEQATALDRALGKQGVDCVLNIRVAHEELVQRLSDRLICRQCQTPYHRTNLPPKVEDRCDRCGGELYQRADDQPKVVQRRLQVQQELLATLLDYYSEQGKLAKVDGEQEIDHVAKQMREAVAHNIPA